MQKYGVLLVIFLLFSFVVSFAASQSTYLIGLNSDGSWEWTNGSPTPVVITTTPQSSQTPWIVTATPGIDTPVPTATQETFNTPSPTPPIVYPKCWGQVTATSLNAREIPWGTVVGQVALGDYLAFDAQWITNDFRGEILWYRIEAWENIGNNEYIGAYVSSNWIELGDTADCSQLEDKTPRIPFIVGLHVTHSYRSQVIAFQYDMNRIGYLSGTANYEITEHCLDSIAPEGTENHNVCRYRKPDDCPANIGVSDPVQSALAYMEERNFAVQSLKSAVGEYVDLLIIELTNECQWEPYEWWATWMNTALDYADDHSWPQLAIPGLGPGYGNYVMFEAWREPLMRNHERGGYLSSHNYSPIQHCGGDGSLSNGNIYCAFRHRLNYQIITEELGYDVRILITEASPTDGYQPVTQATLDDIGAYTCMIAKDEGLAGIFYWNVGDFAPFADANLGPYLVPLAESIKNCGT